MKHKASYIVTLLALHLGLLEAKRSVETSIVTPEIDSCYLMRVPLGVPPAINAACDGPDFYASASYTLWTARQEGMALSVGNISPSAFNPGKAFYPNFKLRSGFKIGLGTFVGHDNWDLGVGYTWFRNEKNGFSSSSTSNSSFPTWIVGTVIPAIIDQTSGKWDDSFNRIDIKLGRAFYLGRTLATKPFLGLMGALEKQTLDIKYTNHNDSSFPSLITEANQQKWWAIGPYLGCNSSFICGRCDNSEWSLFFNGGSSLAFGNYKTKNSTLFYVPALDGPIRETEFNGNNSVWNFSPMLELSLGLRFETFHSATYKWASLVELAWEGQVWLSHNQMALLNKLCDGSNYSLQGLTFTLHGAF